MLTRGQGQHPCNKLEAQEEEYNSKKKSKQTTHQQQKNLHNAGLLKKPEKLNFKNRNKTLYSYVWTFLVVDCILSLQSFTLQDKGSGTCYMDHGTGNNSAWKILQEVSSPTSCSQQG